MQDKSAKCCLTLKTTVLLYLRILRNPSPMQIAVSMPQNDHKQAESPFPLCVCVCIYT